MRGRLMRIGGAAITVLCLAACALFVPPGPDRGGEVRAPWVLYGEAANRLEIGVMMGGADCQRFTGVDLIESDESVEIQAWFEELSADACVLVRRYHAVTVDLSSPLGDRTLTGCLIEEIPPGDGRISCADLVQ